jgi:hypothetical protein
VQQSQPPNAKDARAALDSGEFDKAATLAVQILDADPQNVNALRVAVMAEGARGRHKSVFQLLNKIGVAGGARLKLLASAMRRARMNEQRDAALTIAFRLVRAAERHPDLLGDVITTIRAVGDGDVFEKLLAALQDPENRAIVQTHLSVYRCSLSQALQDLERIPTGHALRFEAVRSIQNLAYVQQNQPVIHQLGKELFATARDINHVSLWRNWHAAAIQKDRNEVRAIYLRAEAELDKVLQDEKAFARTWRGMALWAFNSFNARAGLNILSTAMARGLTDEAEQATYKDAEAFIGEFQEEFDLARANMRALSLGEPVTWPANELIRVASRPKVVNIGNENTFAHDIAWMRLIAEVGREAKKHGGAISFVQEGGAVLSEAGAPMTISYHTHGRTDRLLHFKEADMPEYYSFDSDGYSGWSSLAAKTVDDLPLRALAADEIDRFFENERRRILASHHSKYAQSTVASAEPLPERYVFVALQIPFDRVQVLARLPMLDMLDIVMRRFAGSEYRVVVKRHPLCRDTNVAATLAKLSADGSILLRNESIHSLIAEADAVIVVNSSVGSEAALHLKPIYTFGGAEYAPIAHNISNEAEFVAKTSPIRLPVSEDTLKRFVYFYRNDFLFNVNESDRLQVAVRQRVIEPALAVRHVRP